MATAENRFGALVEQSELPTANAGEPLSDLQSDLSSQSRRSEFEQLTGLPSGGNVPLTQPSQSRQSKKQQKRSNNSSGESSDEPSDADETEDSTTETEEEKPAEGKSWTETIVGAISDMAQKVLPEQVFAGASEVAQGHVLSGAREILLGKKSSADGEQQTEESSSEQQQSSSEQLQQQQSSDEPSLEKLNLSDESADLSAENRESEPMLQSPPIVLAEERSESDVVSSPEEHWETVGSRGHATTDDDRVRGEAISADTLGVQTKLQQADQQSAQAFGSAM